MWARPRWPTARPSAARPNRTRSMPGSRAGAASTAMSRSASSRTRPAKGTSLSTFKLDNEHSIEEVFDIVLHLLDKPKEVIKIMIEQASSKDSNLDNNNLELYLHHLVSIKGSIFLSNQGLDRRIKDLEKILVH